MLEVVAIRSEKCQRLRAAAAPNPLPQAQGNVTALSTDQS